VQVKAKNILIPVFIGSVVVVLIGLAMRKASEGPTPVDQQSLERNAEFQRETREADQKNKLDMVGLYLGPVEKDQLDVCYSGGYPSESAFRNHLLSRREAAECDVILKKLSKLEARDAAAKAEADAAYDKAHPVKWIPHGHQCGRQCGRKLP
jgi:hypothetical protein